MAVILGEGSSAAQEEPPRKVQTWAEVPWRTIVATVGIVLAALALTWIFLAVYSIVIAVVVSGFFAVVLSPAVRWVQVRVHGRRGLATAIVMFGATFVALGTILLFLWPVRAQLLQVVTDLPGTVKAAAEGRGPVGHIVKRLNLQNFVRDHETELDKWANGLRTSSVAIAGKVLSAVIAVITVFVITFLFLTQSKAIGTSALRLVPNKRRALFRRVAVDASGAVSGYMIGNLLISLFAGVAALICLLLIGVPSAIVFALWVAFTDLIPLVGATLGAAVAVVAAFLHSPTAGIIALIFFVVYQQFENTVLQPTVMARTVKVNPLVVILSVLLGAELLGLLGALLAIPVAGSILVVAKEIMHERDHDRLELPYASLDDL